MSESPQPSFAIEKIYIKDLSVEVPNGPEVFLEQEAPSMEVNIKSNARPMQAGLYEVVLTVTVTARIKEKTLFLVEAAQAGVFQILNVPQPDIGPLLGIACPNTLFPYVRETISTVTARAGFQPVLLAPMTFEGIYQQQMQQMQEQPPGSKPN
jgi:preprotein translocase subunit SecB